MWKNEIILHVSTCVLKHFSDREKIRKLSTEKNFPPQELSKEYIDMCTTKFKIGNRKFGEVFLGVDGKMGKRFAIERLKYSTLEGKNFQVQRAQKSIEKELRTFNNTQHPHIARLYGYYLSDDVHGEQLLVYDLDNMHKSYALY